MLDRLALLVATAAGVGRVPVLAPTLASAGTAFALWITAPSLGWRVALLLIVTALGTWAGGRAERLLGRKDPGAIVVDEVAGMMLTVLAAGTSAAVLVVGFLLFRVFDVTKPFPAGASQRLRGGLGVMVDDLIAGLYGLGVFLLLHAVVGWP